MKQMLVSAVTLIKSTIRDKRVNTEDLLDLQYEWYEVISLPRNIIYSIKSRFFKGHIYHKVYLDQEPGYSDPVHLLLEAPFTIFARFYEEEVNEEAQKDQGWGVDYEYDQKHCDARIEMEDLYMWWKARPFRQTDLYSDNSSTVEDWQEWEAEEQEMLERLIKLRNFLWT